MVEVALKEVTKRFGEVLAADNITLKVNNGEFFTFLGPSGCGKTTTLRIIAGLEFPDSGKLFFDDDDVTNLPTYKRNTGMVFQNYALWPHMSVFDNVAYGLKIRKISKEEAKERVQKVLNLVNLAGLENRYPTQLSGGQQQRVALARALVIEPKVLLFDEPLSNLDAKLRLRMREEIKDLQKRLKITTIYVTHDQEEAMVISDRIAIQNKGKILQVGTPTEIYNRPQSLFVATFIGGGSLLEGIADKVGEKIQVKINNSAIQGTPSSDEQRIKEGDKVAVVLRPENFVLEKPRSTSNQLRGIVEWTAFVGSRTDVRINMNERRLLIHAPPDIMIPVGKEVTFYISQEDTIILPMEEVS
ncbi:ABC transporter ATP-binding protein [Candidatus Bathyarchaeota archaeon]|nr:ABC transporter ATP-binding protein [Candidatus Bathyarchaeota archaeon]